MCVNSLIVYLNFLIRSKKTKTRSADKEEDLFIATHYIYLVCLLKEHPHTMKMLGKWVYSYFWNQPVDHLYD